MKLSSFRPFERLKTCADFDRIFKHPIKTSGKNLLILWKPGITNCTRIGIIAGKKVSKRAVLRNQIRRIIKDSFRHSKKSFGLIDIIVIAKQPCAKLSREALRQETENLWQKLKQQSQKFQLS